MQKGRIEQSAADAAVGRIEIAETLAEFAGCQIVVEAIFEDLEAKRALFRELEGVVDGGCVLASNTSSLSVTAMAAACAKPA